MGLTAKDAAKLYRNCGLPVPADLESVPKQSKWRNVKTPVDGIVFDSALEADVYRILKLWESAGVIRDLSLQPRFELQPGFRDNEGQWVRAIVYFADFGFFDIQKHRQRYADAKGRRTAVFALKLKMLKRYRPDIELELWTRDTVKMFGGQEKGKQ